MKVDRAPAELRAQDLMSSQVLTVSHDLPVDRLAQFLVDNSISGAPVTDDDGKPIGVVSTTDLARIQSQPMEIYADINPRYFHPIEEGQLAVDELTGMFLEQSSEATVADIMTPVMFSVDEETPVAQVADTMIRGRIHRLLVTRNKRVVGIISAYDLLRVIRDFARA